MITFWSSFETSKLILVSFQYSLNLEKLLNLKENVTQNVVYFLNVGNRLKM